MRRSLVRFWSQRIGWCATHSVLVFRGNVYDSTYLLRWETWWTWNEAELSLNKTISSTEWPLACFRCRLHSHCLSMCVVIQSWDIMDIESISSRADSNIQFSLQRRCHPFSAPPPGHALRVVFVHLLHTSSSSVGFSSWCSRLSSHCYTFVFVLSVSFFVLPSVATSFCSSVKSIVTEWNSLADQTGRSSKVTVQSSRRFPHLHH